MKHAYLEILDFLYPGGYFARSDKEKEVFESLMKDKKVFRKKGTKRVYILSKSSNETQNNTKISKREFISIIMQLFKKFRTNYKPFVSIQEIREELISSYKLDKSEIDSRIISLYEEGIVELEQALSNSEDQKHGLEAKNGKIFKYILDITE